MSRRISWIAALALAVAAAALPGAAAAEKIVLQLDGPAQFEFAGYYAALWQGYYRAAGLDVTIKPGASPGQTPIDPVREVTEGRARFGTGSARLLIRDAQGLPLLLLAPIFQSSGAMVYSRADTPFSSPGALLRPNVKIGRLPASTILDIELRTALKAEGIDPGTLHSVPIEPGGAVAALQKGTVDAVIGSAWQVPWQAHERGLALKSFDPAAYRPEFYGDSLFTLQRFAAAEPETVAHFRAASLKGWEYALLHPQEMATRLLTELPQRMPVSDPSGFIHYQAELAGKLARYPGVPIGHSNPERWRHIAAAMAGAEAITRPVDLGDFLYDPQAAARRDLDRRTWAEIAGAALLCVLLGAGLLGYRRRRAARRRQRMIAEEVASLAAELRAIADRVGGALEQIRRHSLAPPQIGRFCATALDGLDHLRAIIRRLASDEEAVNPRASDLNAALTTLERTLRRDLPRGVDFRLSLLPELWLCRADPEAAEAAVLALAKAAADDMPKGGELIIGTRHASVDAAAASEMEIAPGPYVRVTVRDSGPGLSDAALDHIFDARATVRPPVAAALRLMRALGGSARVESAEGIGTAVHLYFPRWADEDGRIDAVDPETAARAAE
ncbi:MAG TPA: ABC transporter substrate-binding protein [Stellaceae bacterium]|nr:ABC transporter substrate-binding protein [Stellaceae bacterium]